MHTTSVLHGPRIYVLKIPLRPLFNDIVEVEQELKHDHVLC
jgi:hypothetical protein